MNCVAGLPVCWGYRDYIGSMDANHLVWISSRHQDQQWCWGMASGPQRCSQDFQSGVIQAHLSAWQAGQACICASPAGQRQQTRQTPEKEIQTGVRSTTTAMGPTWQQRENSKGGIEGLFALVYRPLKVKLFNTAFTGTNSVCLYL